MDEDKASRFISSLVKSIQALCNGFVDFSSSIEVVGHIHLNIDRSVKLDYVLTEEVSKSVSEGSTVFSSHSYHSQPPPSILSSKSASDTSNHGQKPRKDNEADPLGLSALPREVPNASKSDSHAHSSNRVSDSSNSSHSFSGNVGFSRTSEPDLLKQENNRSSCQMEDSSNKRRKMGSLSQRTPSPAAKRSRTNDFSSGSRTVIKEPGFEVIEIKEEPEEEPAVFFGSSASGQDIQTPDFSNVVMESLDRVNQIEQGTDLVGDGGGGEGMAGPQQPVFPVMFHQSDGMSSSTGPVPGPSSDPQSVASTSGDTSFTNTGERRLRTYSDYYSFPPVSMSYGTGYRRYSRASLRLGVIRVLQGETVRKVSIELKLPRETLRRHVEKAKRSFFEAEALERMASECQDASGGGAQTPGALGLNADSTGEVSQALDGSGSVAASPGGSGRVAHSVAGSWGSGQEPDGCSAQSSKNSCARDSDENSNLDSEGTDVYAADGVGAYDA